MAVAARGGVPTAMKTARPPGGCNKVGGEEQPLLARVLGDELVQTGLVDRHLAARRAAILSASLSTQVTTWPKSAKQAPETRPT